MALWALVLRFGRGGRWFRPSQPCLVSARKRTRVVRKKIFSWKRVAPHTRGTWYTGLSGEEQVDQDDLDNYADDDSDGDIGDHNHNHKDNYDENEDNQNDADDDDCGETCGMAHERPQRLAGHLVERGCWHTHKGGLVHLSWF